MRHLALAFIEGAVGEGRLRGTQIQSRKISAARALAGGRGG